MWSQRSQRYWSDRIDSRCQVQTVYKSVLVVHICVGSCVRVCVPVACLRVHVSGLVICPQKFNDPFWLCSSFKKMWCWESFSGGNSAGGTRLLTFIYVSLWCKKKRITISNWAQNGSIPFRVYTLTPIFQSAPFPCSVSPLWGRGVKQVLVEIPLYRMGHFF